MNLQDIFYILGIAVMTSFLFFLIFISIFIMIVYRQLKRLQLKAETVTKMGKVEIVGAVATALATFMFNRIFGRFRR